MKASRKFVCVRLATYEDEAELPFLKSVYAPGGVLKNTVFGILSPDGKQKLVRSGRSPRFAFRGVGDFAKSLQKIAARYEPRDVQPADLGVPYVKSVRLALNVASCDQQPLVVVVGKADARRAAERKLAGLIWKKPFVGQALYTVTEDPADLKSIDGAKMSPAQGGILFVKPSAFGVAGRSVTRVALDADAKAITAALTKLMKQHRPRAKESSEHVREARELGIEWQPATPVTDQGGRRKRGGSRRRRR